MEADKSAIVDEMANPEHLAILRQGVEVWNRWRKDHLGREPDLSRAMLRGHDLAGASLHSANLSNADLAESVLAYANLVDANLIGANLRESALVLAQLVYASLNRANLTGVNLTGANLTSTNLEETAFLGAKLNGATIAQAYLHKTDFRHAEIGWTNFGGLNLSTSVGLDTITHTGPSSIGIDTIHRWKGNIPEAFLRGAGVPEQFITYARSLVGQTGEFYSCFISYLSQDQIFAERLHADLRAKNLRVWFAPEDLKIGDRFQDRIEESIHLYDKVMIIPSDASVKSRWVEREVSAAWERENREKRLVLFPTQIDDALLDATAPWAADLRRQRHIGDFTRWKDHEAYQNAFDRLLRDLRAETRAPAH